MNCGRRNCDATWHGGWPRWSNIWLGTTDRGLFIWAKAKILNIFEQYGTVLSRDHIARLDSTQLNWRLCCGHSADQIGWVESDLAMWSLWKLNSSQLDKKSPVWRQSWSCEHTENYDWQKTGDFLSSWVELNWVGFLLFRVITYRSTQLKSIQLNWPLTLSRVTRCNHGHRVKWKCENRGDLQNNFGSSENDRKFGLLNARIDLIYRIAAILRQEGLASRPPKIRVSLLPVMLDETPKLFFFVVWAQALSTNSVTVKVLMT